MASTGTPIASVQDGGDHEILARFILNRNGVELCQIRFQMLTVQHAHRIIVIGLGFCERPFESLDTSMFFILVPPSVRSSASGVSIVGSYRVSGVFVTPTTKVLLVSAWLGNHVD